MDATDTLAVLEGVSFGISCIVALTEDPSFVVSFSFALLAPHFFRSLWASSFESPCFLWQHSHSQCPGAPQKLQVLKVFLPDRIVGCIYAPYKVNPNIFQFYCNFLDIFHHTSMHPLFRNIYEFYSIFYNFISSFIIYNNHLYLRRHFLFWFHLAPDLLILSRTLCPELKSRPCMRS